MFLQLASYLLYSMKRTALAAKALALLFSQSLVNADIYLLLMMKRSLSSNIPSFWATQTDKYWNLIQQK